MDDRPEFCTVRWTATWPEVTEPHGVRGPHVCAVMYPHEVHKCCCGATLRYKVWDRIVKGWKDE